MTPLIHHAHRYAIQHGATAHKLLRAGLISTIALTAFLVILIAVDIVLTHDASEANAMKAANECIGVLNGDMKMLDGETGEVARISWEKFNLVGGVK